MEAKELILWNHEAYYEPPAYKQFKIYWEGNLYSATLYLDLNPEMPPYYGCATKIEVNGVEYNPSAYGDPCDVIQIDITDALIQGLNTVKFYYNTLYSIYGTVWGTAYGTVSVAADKIITMETEQQEDFWKYLPWLIGGILAVSGLFAIGYLARSIPVSEVKKAVSTAKSVAEETYRTIRK